VLIALPDTRTGFKTIVRNLKQGGRCFIWVYHPISKTYYPDAWRKLAVYNWVRENITSRLPIRVQYYLYLSWIPAFLVKQWVERVLGLKEADFRKRVSQELVFDESLLRSKPLTWREKMQDFFDFFSAPYQHRHEPAEVIGWFREEGFSNARVAYPEYEGFAVRGDLDRLPNPDVSFAAAERIEPAHR
jgi:hypothetical protein